MSKNRDWTDPDPGLPYTTTLPISIARRLDEFCAENGVSKSFIMREATIDWLNRECPDVDK